jgi:type IV pilus assembly protein PilF
MTTTAPVFRDARRRLAWAAIGATLLLALAGCASTPSGQAGGSRDIVTESDETEAHRRARIRMELATGYFEQGKTNVALDELKQVIASDPSYSDAYNLRGLIYMRLNDFGQAEESFRRAVALNPRDSNAQHNYGWLLCQQGRYDEAQRAFDAALSNNQYGEGAKTQMTQGLCQAKAGRMAEAERSLVRSYEMDAGNPITGYNLSNVLYKRGDLARAQFYIRRLNNSQLANAETLWLGIRIEHRLHDQVAANQLAQTLRKRFPQSRETAAYERRAFDE